MCKRSRSGGCGGGGEDVIWVIYLKDRGGFERKMATSWIGRGGHTKKLRETTNSCGELKYLTGLGVSSVKSC